MLVYLLRHGKAQATAESDAARELTREGLVETRSVVEKFETYTPTLDVALISPYQRARQTAALVRPLFPSMRFDVDKSITPSGDVYGVLDTIEQLDVQHVMLVSHNPFLSNLLSVMVDGTMESSRNIGNSTLICVSMDVVAPGCGEILYTLEP